MGIAFSPEAPASHAGPEARAAGQKPDMVMDAALGLAGVKDGSAAALTKAALSRNLDFAEKLGCLDAEGMSEMHKGKAPTVRHGPCKGNQLSVDNTVCPELDNVIADLELMPLRMNESKNDRVGARQVDLARKFNKAGMLSDQANHCQRVLAIPPKRFEREAVSKHSSNQ